jgi:hypothetical protein
MKCPAFVAATHAKPRGKVSMYIFSVFAEMKRTLIVLTHLKFLKTHFIHVRRRPRLRAETVACMGPFGEDRHFGPGTGFAHGAPFMLSYIIKFYDIIF